MSATYYTEWKQLNGSYNGNRVTQIKDRGQTGIPTLTLKIWIFLKNRLWSGKEQVQESTYWYV